MANRNLFNDYFSKNPRFNDSMFCRRFRMSRSLFNRITNAVQGHDNYFMQRRDGVDRLRLSGLQKIIVVFRMLAYGMPIDASDEYIKIGESTTIESLKRFCRTIVEVFVEQYLRSPNTNDAARLLHVRKDGTPTIILEAVVDYDIWIWHAHFGLPGSNNDINVLEASHLFANLASEAYQKDVKRAFEVLQSRFAIVAGPSRFWIKHELHDIMIVCIIIHNMIIEDERDVNATINDWMQTPIPTVAIRVDENIRFQEFLARHKQIKDKEAHIAL
ncbi:hypothetical protein WN944_019110 [Citrus x changshan-huyou]|uniref:Nuclease HARBI1 n=1 Tax=Citrus x changshan-huyou TaxID=2935761 RepID=A0AAP0QDQ6_9ROSI